MTPSWMRTFEQERARCHFCFLFDGNVADGFPNTTDASSMALLPWHRLVLDALVRQEPDRRFVVFDPALGLSFPRDEDHEAFGELLKKNRQSAGEADDPIARARAQVASRVEQTTDPTGALSQIMNVLRHAVGDSVRFTVILPNVDTYCLDDSSPAGAMSSRTPLLIRRMAEDDAFGIVGHLVLMSARSSGLLPQMLRDSSSPICLIKVDPPLQAEREAYLRRVCRTDSGLQRQQELEMQIAEEIQVLQARANDDIVAARTADERHSALRKSLKQDGEYKGHLAAVKRCRSSLTALRQSLNADNAGQLANLQAQIDALGAQLRSDPLLTDDASLDEARWANLAPGDMVSVQDSRGGAQRFTVLKSATRRSGVQFASGANPNKPVTDSRNSSIPAQFFFEGGLLVMRFKANDADICVANADNVACLTVKPFARKQATECLEELQRNLEALCSSEPASIREAQSELDRLTTAAVSRLQELQEDHTRIAQQLAQTLRDSKARLPNLSSETLTDLREQHRRLTATRDDESLFDTPTMGVVELARLTGNMGYRDLRRLLRRAQAGNQPLSHKDVVAHRLVILNERFGHLFEVIDPPYGFDGIAGLDGVKTFLLDVCERMRTGDLSRVPMGCALLGPPGTGKSALATALAHASGLLLLIPRHTQQMWVGSSERNVHDQLEAVRLMAPCVVFQDEIDQNDGGRDGFSGDSGVSNRTRQAWMTFLADPTIRGRVFYMTASNRPDLIDAAMLRAGRSDEVIPVLMPDATTREALFRVMIRRGGFTTDITDFTEFADKTKRLSGADIEVIVRHADTHGEPGVNRDDLLWAIGDYMPQAQQTQIARMTLLAVANARSRALLPANARDEVEWALEVLKQHGEESDIRMQVIPPVKPSVTN